MLICKAYFPWQQFCTREERILGYKNLLTLREKEFLDILKKRMSKNRKPWEGKKNI